MPPKFDKLQHVSDVIKESTSDLFLNQVAAEGITQIPKVQFTPNFDYRPLIPKQLDQVMDDNVKLKVNLKMKDYYERETLQKMYGSLYDSEDQERLNKLRERYPDKTEEEIRQIFNKNKKRQSDVINPLAQFLNKLDPTGSTESFLKYVPGVKMDKNYYENMNIAGKNKVYEELVKACIFIFSNVLEKDHRIYLIHHNLNSEKCQVNNKFNFNGTMNPMLDLAQIDKLGHKGTFNSKLSVYCYYDLDTSTGWIL